MSLVDGMQFHHITDKYPEGFDTNAIYRFSLHTLSSQGGNGLMLMYRSTCPSLNRSFPLSACRPKSRSSCVAHIHKALDTQVWMQ